MDLFTQLSIIIVISAAIAGMMRLLKQPLIIGYILVGLLIGPMFLGFVQLENSETLAVFSELGVSILLFIVGMHLSPTEVRDFGKSAFIVGFFQVVLTTLLGFATTLLFGYPLPAALYIGIALSFSSTIVVLKFISDKKELDSLYGRVTIGILLLQDIVAALVLIAAAAFSPGESGVNLFLSLMIKGLALTLVLSLISYYLLPSLSSFFAKSQEFLFLFALAWGFGLASLFKSLGFSIEIGALVAGISLSMSPYAEEISSKLKPLRDFFILMFFILLGARVDFLNLSHVLLPTIVLSALALLIKPLIIQILMGIFKYAKKTGFYTAASLSQISEFSLILAILGLSSGQISQEVFSIITLTGIITIAVSAYIIKYTDRLYFLLSPSLKIFERPNAFEQIETLGGYEIVLFGCNRMGYDFIESFKEHGSSFLAVDFDPEIVSNLMEEGINVKYGDADDGEFLEDIKIGETKIVISTIPDYETNLFLLEKAKKDNPEVMTVLSSRDLDQAIKLYEEGADYVIVPHFIGGQIVSNLAKEAVLGHKSFEDERNRHLTYLKTRKALGHASQANSY